MVKRAEDWPWCSYGAAIGFHPPDPIVDEEALLGLFSPRPAVGRKHLRRFVEEVNPRERWRQTQLRRGSETAQTPRSATTPS